MADTKGGSVVTSVDTEAFDQALRELSQAVSQRTVRRLLRQIAEDILERAIVSPTPFDTGLLTRGGSVQDDGDFVVFGFTAIDPDTGYNYAAVQNFGTRSGDPPGPSKGYGSDIGPNEYLSGTLKVFGPRIVPTLASLVENELARRARSSRSLRGRLRRFFGGRFFGT